LTVAQAASRPRTSSFKDRSPRIVFSSSGLVLACTRRTVTTGEVRHDAPPYARNPATRAMALSLGAFRIYGSSIAARQTYMERILLWWDELDDLIHVARHLVGSFGA
jgi:hypothetical protein